MKHLLRNIAILLLSLGLPSAQAQLPNAQGAAVKGNFHVAINDQVEIYVNGTQVANGANKVFASPEVGLLPGDRIVVKLKNVAAKRWFMIAFMSTDRKQMISFTPTSFRILPDAAINDFTAADYSRFTKPAKLGQGDAYPLPVKSASKWVWGELDICSLGCLLTTESFKPNTRQ